MELLNLEEDIIDKRIVRAVKEMGFKQFSPIQEQSIPEILKGKDVIGQAQTGTGKTAAFGIPLLQMIDLEVKGTQALVLCPTRELAMQAAEEIRKFAKYMSGIRVLAVYGGQEIYKQIKALKGNVQIIVGTPGRVMDHMRRHTIKLDNLQMVVLDEADEMLNMGFREDMEQILSQIKQEHQTVLFSATMPKAILDITGQFQDHPILIKTVKKELTVQAIKQCYYQVRKEDKKEATARLLEYYAPKRTLVFCNTKRMVEELAEDIANGYKKVIRDLYDAGCRNIQLDDCSWGMCVDPHATAIFGTDEAGLQKIMEQLLAINNRAIEGSPEDLVINTHVCRGNFHSTYASSGAYDRVAEALFARENVSAYYLEFDDARSGGFEPLKSVSGDKKVVLGLITTKSPKLEDKEDVIKRIHEAAKYVPLDRLYLSPQCGFASCEIGNKLTEEQQWAKLKLVKEIAEEVWG